ncbi:hypothetical protein BGZ97_001345 [Linnemannia gamsii]|jgi:hypothetical protein|uniref:Uncharacterized protein n=1 Tax=Linnemannia gamsii TaxID=64522 RepID=A0A9P6QWF5_9FUNG|nr:hypothetical protein BGZ97_001345 [Linnemannia gamsii]
MRPAASQFFSTTELVALMAAYLGQRALSRLMRTCPHMNVLWAPFLYRRMFISYNAGKRSLFGSPHSTLAFAKNSQYVRELDIDLLGLVYYLNGVTVFNNFRAISTGSSLSEPRWRCLPDPRTCLVLPIPPTTLLTKLTICTLREATDRACPYYLHSISNPRATMSQVCWLIQLNPCLRELILTGLIFKDCWDIQLFTNAVYGLIQLRELVLVAEFWEGTALQLGRTIFFACPLSLKVFDVALMEKNFSQDRMLMGDYLTAEPGAFHSWEREEDEGDLPTTPVRQEPLTELRRLCLQQFGDLICADDFLSITRHCPNIRVLEMPVLCEVKNVGKLAKDIVKTCRKLVWMAHRVDSTATASSELLLRIMEALPPQLISLVFFGGKAFKVQEPDTAELFRRHSTTLTSLFLGGCRNVDGRVIQVILTECEALKGLNIPWQGQGQELSISLQEVIEYSWVCTGLRDLVLTIGVLVGPLSQTNGAHPYYIRSPPTALSMEEKDQFESLEEFYKEIGALEQLETLKLSVFFFDPTGMRPLSWEYRKNAFPGMLSMGNIRTGRPGYLHHLTGWKKLKTRSGSVSADVAEIKKTMGWAEAVWMDAS